MWWPASGDPLRNRPGWGCRNVSAPAKIFRHSSAVTATGRVFVRMAVEAEAFPSAICA